MAEGARDPQEEEYSSMNIHCISLKGKEEWPDKMQWIWPFPLHFLQQSSHSGALQNPSPVSKRQHTRCGRYLLALDKIGGPSTWRGQVMQAHPMRRSD